MGSSNTDLVHLVSLQGAQKVATRVVRHPGTNRAHEGSDDVTSVYMRIEMDQDSASLLASGPSNEANRARLK
jgi:hypothetical protein